MPLDLNFDLPTALAPTQVFAARLQTDRAASKEVIKLLFAMPEHRVPAEEVLEGNSMIFIKRLTTISGE